MSKILSILFSQAYMEIHIIVNLFDASNFFGLIQNASDHIDKGTLVHVSLCLR